MLSASSLETRRDSYRRAFYLTAFCQVGSVGQRIRTLDPAFIAAAHSCLPGFYGKGRQKKDAKIFIYVLSFQPIGFFYSFVLDFLRDFLKVSEGALRLRFLKFRPLTGVLMPGDVVG